MRVSINVGPVTDSGESTISDGSFYPHKWTVTNYTGIFKTSLFTRALINSIGRQTDTVTPTIATANLRLTPVEEAASALAARHGGGNGRVVDLTVR